MYISDTKVPKASSSWEAEAGEPADGGNLQPCSGFEGYLDYIPSCLKEQQKDRLKKTFSAHPTKEYYLQVPRSTWEPGIVAHASHL